MSAPKVFALALVLGTLLGFSQHREGTPSLLAYSLALGAPWLLAVLWLSTKGRSLKTAALAGSLLLGSGTVVHYLAFAMDGAPGYAISMATIWGFGAAVAGLAMGALAYRARGNPADGRRGRPFLLVTAGAILLGEAAVLITEWTYYPGRLVVGAELALGAALIGLGARPRAGHAVLAAATIATAVFVGESLIREFARSSGWRGA